MQIRTAPLFLCRNARLYTAFYITDEIRIAALKL